VSGYGLVPPESGPALGAWAAGLPPGVLSVDPVRTRRVPGRARTPYALTVSTIVMGTPPGSATSRAVSETGLFTVTVTTTQEPPDFR